MTDEKTTLRPAAEKIAGGLREVLELIKAAQEADPGAWNGLDDPASVARRKAAIWSVKQ